MSRLDFPPGCSVSGILKNTPESREDDIDFDKRSALASLAADRGLEIDAWVRARGVRLSDGRIVRSITSYNKAGMELFTIKFNTKEDKRSQWIEDEWMAAPPRPRPGWRSAYELAGVSGDEWFCAMEQTWAEWRGLTWLSRTLPAPSAFRRGDRVLVINFSKQLDGRKGIIKGYEKRRKKFRIKIERKSMRAFLAESQMVEINIKRRNT